VATVSKATWIGSDGREYDNHPRIDHDRRSKLTTEQRDEIVQRYHEGEPAGKLALEFGVSAALVRRYAGSR
jgi:transposase-like protein